MVVSGIVAVTLSPVMSSRFVHAHGQEGRLTRAGEPRVRRGAPAAMPGCWTVRSSMRWAIVAAAVLVMVAAWPLYSYSRQELAPVEDQSHISLFMLASPDSSLAATEPGLAGAW